MTSNFPCKEPIGSRKGGLVEVPISPPPLSHSLHKTMHQGPDSSSCCTTPTLAPAARTPIQPDPSLLPFPQILETPCLIWSVDLLSKKTAMCDSFD